MRNTTGTLFTFLEDVFALRGFGASAPAARAAGNDRTNLSDSASGPGAANENETRGLAPMVSVAVSVCPVPPVATRAQG